MFRYWAVLIINSPTNWYFKAMACVLACVFSMLSRYITKHNVSWSMSPLLNWTNEFNVIVKYGDVKLMFTMWLALMWLALAKACSFSGWTYIFALTCCALANCPSSHSHPTLTPPGKILNFNCCLILRVDQLLWKQHIIFLLLQASCLLMWTSLDSFIVVFNRWFLCLIEQP